MGGRLKDMATRKSSIHDENPEWTDDDFASARPAGLVLRELLSDADAAALLVSKRPGRPKLESPKKYTGLRLDQDIIDTFKLTGNGWQTRINNALRDWLKTHSPVAGG
jgi:uncharacterized protein (DUF4415 family)